VGVLGQLVDPPVGKGRKIEKKERRSERRILGKKMNIKY
jgi:hypothetical protein